MTEKNADVEWLRRVCGNQSWDLGLPIERARRLLAHIDQLEADIRSWEAEVVMHHRESREDRRPTVHEIAVQMMAALVASDDRCLLLETLANESYRAAEALVAEGRRRDGMHG